MLDVYNFKDTSIEDALKGVYDGYTVTYEGKAIACIGVKELTPHSAFAWALLKNGIREQFHQIHKCVSAWLCATGYDIIYCDVREGFIEGLRWVRLLGFTQCDTKENYYDDGGNAIIFKRERL